ncbi:hypothetical protein CDN99_27350 [Roseateles aquatilis]|uniref:SEC-C domain-containing protein n=2 Tax=Roseateles aquatilis TaxID=431061 RepID=A0A2D0ALS4_9BURK|nr:hypothetical protein CDN99_27350 [Roseateles aquatilis]
MQPQYIHIPRNSKCPCQSGLRFKECHGRLGDSRTSEDLANAKAILFNRKIAIEHQRQKQQGLGPAISSHTSNETRVLKIGSKEITLPKDQTFLEFLDTYTEHILSSEWWITECEKPDEDAHTVVKWHRQQALQKSRLANIKKGFQLIRFTGAMEASARFAYDLYCLSVSNEVQQLLIARLKNAEQFPGAMQEISVAAILLRAGFRLDFEDETDGSTKHHEFTATHIGSGIQYSVEAKRSEGSINRIGRLLSSALRKPTRHPRLIFINLNKECKDNADFMHLASQTESQFKRLDSQPASASLPPAYVICTNNPWESRLDSIEYPTGGLIVYPFRMPDFLELKRGTLRQLINARARHAPIEGLMRSIMEHSVIPSTWDGQIPIFAHGLAPRRFVIGEPCTVTNADGEVSGILLNAIVSENEKQVACVVQKSDGTHGIGSTHLSEEEIIAWKQHPKTFFGVLNNNNTIPIDGDPLELYDFFYIQILKSSSRDRLIQDLAGSEEGSSLESMTFQELASKLAERQANHLLASLQYDAPL